MPSLARLEMEKMNKFRLFELKADLLVNGIDASPEALTGVGQNYKEQNHRLFGWDFEDHVNITLPDAFSLPDGTIVQFRKNSYSKYLVNKMDGKFLLNDAKKKKYARSNDLQDHPITPRKQLLITVW